MPRPAPRVAPATTATLPRSPSRSGAQLISRAQSSTVEPLLQAHDHVVTGLFGDGLAHIGLDRQLVGAVSERHERAAEGMAVDSAAHLHQPAGAEILGRSGHDDIGPSALGLALLQGGVEGLPQCAHWLLPPLIFHSEDERGGRNSSTASPNLRCCAVRGERWVALVAAVVVLTLTLATSCTNAVHHQIAAPAGASPAVAPATTTTVPLLPWTGPVEHLFFHTLIVRPDLAFHPHDRLAQGLRDYFVTVTEFRRMLDQLYANGWTLVDIHRAVAGQVRVPAGRRPFVLSEDDVNYYDYSRQRGVGWKLVVDEHGAVKVELHDAAGIHVTDEDLIPLVDEFVASHPLFSAEGAKGVIAVTGYEGVFGEPVQDVKAPDRAERVGRATAIAARLRATGWTLASHSYGHIDFARDSLAVATRDTQHWA